MTIKAQKHKLLRDDWSVFVDLLLNKINTEIWNTMFKSQMIFPSWKGNLILADKKLQYLLSLSKD